MLGRRTISYELNIPTDLDYFASLNPGFYFFRR